MSTNERIVFLLSVIFVAGIGFGITLPVLPFYAERLMSPGSGTESAMALHVTGLTSVYAFTQFLFAPVWGAWSDRSGRKRMIGMGILGSAASQVLFGLSTSLLWLYGARILGGFLSASLLPAATAYVADLSTDENRSRHMAWLGTVSSLATVGGLALGGAVSAPEFHLRTVFLHFRLDAFSMPFFIAALFMIVSAAVVWIWLPESTPRESSQPIAAPVSWPRLAVSLAGLLVLAIAGQTALTAFEATFPLIAQRQSGYGPKEIGLAFMVCGLVMAIFQVIAVTYASRRIRALTQLSIGFALMGLGIMLLIPVTHLAGILAAIGILALGMAFIAPNISALTASGRGSQTGAAMGLLSAANSMGQAAGPMIGGALYAWQIESPYFVSGAAMIVTALILVLGRRKLALGKCLNIRPCK